MDYYFTDNWVGNVYNFATIREAKKEAKKHTYGHSIAIYSRKSGSIVTFVAPRENPLP